MTDPEIACAYRQLKPVCENLMKTPNLQTVTDVIKMTKVLPDKVLQQIHAYVLFPFTVHLKTPPQKSNSKLKMALVEGFQTVLSKVNVESHEIFFKYYTVLILQFFDKKPGDSDYTAAKIDEDFAVIVCNCLTLLLVKLKPEARMFLYTRKAAPEIGQGIYFCVQIARTEKYKKLRIASVESVMALSTVHDDIYKQLYCPRIDVECAKTVGDILMFFLPGLLGALLEISVGDAKQGEKITCMALRAMRRIICIVMLDKEMSKEKVLTDSDFIDLVKNYNPDSNKVPDDYDPFGKKFRHKGKEGILEHLENAKRDELWYSAAGLKLAILIRSLRPVKANPHERVRYELGLLCSDIVEHCMIHMTPSMKFILEMLIGLSETEDIQLAKLCVEALKKFKKKTENGSRKIMELVEQNFYTYLSQIPRFLNSLDNNHQFGNLALLRGYIRFLTIKSENKNNKLSKLEEMLSSPFMLNRFVVAILEIFKLHTRQARLLDNVNSLDIGDSSKNFTPWKMFVHLHSTTNVAVASDICRLLGMHKIVESIADYLFDSLKSKPENRKEIFHMLNETVCCPTEDVSKKEHIFKTLINTYIDPENWYLPIRIKRTEKSISKRETLDISVYNPRSWSKETTPGLYEGTVETRYTDVSYRRREKDEDEDSEEENNPDCSTLMQARDNIIQMCLVTEGIGMAAKLLGDKFQPYLLKTLYLVLERAGSHNEFLHLAGLRTLQLIADSCKLGSIAELIRVNSDYFTHHVKMKLRKYTDNNGVMDVLLVVMKFSESTILPCLFDIISNVLYQCFGVNQQKNVLSHLRLFQSFVNYCSKKFNPCTLEKEKSVAHGAKLNIMQQIVNYKSLRIQSVNFEKEVDEICTYDLHEQYLDTSPTQEELESEEKGEITKTEPPPHIKMIAAIISKVLNFIPAKDRDHKLLAIHIIKQGLPIIKKYEDICLPLVHQVWAPLVNRFKETSQPLVIHRAFELLVVLGMISEDFIKSRTVKDILPILCTFLDDSSKESYNKDMGSIYRQSQTYKLQLTLLENIGKLCVALKFNEKQFNGLMEAVTVYLGCKQPKPLQIACVELFKQFMDYDPAPTWLYLTTMTYESMTIAPPYMCSDSSELNSVSFSSFSPQKKMEYAKNITLILDHYNVLYGNSALIPLSPQDSSRSDES